MAVLYISEAEAVRDFPSLLAQVRAGTEVVIENEDSTVAVITPPGAEVVDEPGYDEWFRAEVQAGLDCDPATDLDEDEAEAHFAEHRRVLLKMLGETE